MVAKACLKLLRLASHRHSAAHLVSCHQVFALPRELSGGKESFVISTVDGHVQTLDVCTLYAHPPFDSICMDTTGGLCEYMLLCYLAWLYRHGRVSCAVFLDLADP